MDAEQAVLNEQSALTLWAALVGWLIIQSALQTATAFYLSQNISCEFTFTAYITIGLTRMQTGSISVRGTASDDCTLPYLATISSTFAFGSCTRHSTSALLMPF